MAGGNGSTRAKAAAQAEVDEPVPFDLPPSREARRAKQNTHVTLAIAAVVVAFVAAAPTRVLDVFGCAAFGYIVYLWTFQNSFLEWPVVGLWELLLLGGAIEAMVAPTCMSYFGLWDHLVWRATAWLFDMIVVVAGYCHMVRGPCWELPAGSLSGRTCIITGCNAGIGFETAKALALAGATVVFACRTESKARSAMKRLVSEAEGSVEEPQLKFLHLDVASLASVRKFAEQVRQEKIPVQTLILNAGVMMGSRAMSEDGFEMTMASNHFGHFLLVQLLLPELLAAEKRSEKPRIVVVGSALAFRRDLFDWSEIAKVAGDQAQKEFLRKPFALFRAYEQSKLANLWFTTELARRLRRKSSSIAANIIHPGEVFTEISKQVGGGWLFPFAKYFSFVALTFLKTMRQGSLSTVYAATAPSLSSADQGSGLYLVRMKPTPLTRLASDERLASRLWERSVELTGAPKVL